jgi:protein-S-isoprenylcysteine O-methyltransferase Ste14
LLPFMNTVVIPCLLVTLFPPALPSAWNATTVAVTAGGAALFTGGATLVAHSIRLFMRFGRGTLAPWDPTHELVSVGAYRFSRNPMKGGLFIVLAGEALVTRSAALLVWFVCFAAVNGLYIRLHEEPGLHRRFGERYRDYCARVPRWWPALRSLRKRAATSEEPAR